MEAPTEVCGTPRSLRFYDLHNTCVILLQSRGVPVKVASEMLGPDDVAITLAVNRSVLPRVQENAGRRGRTTKIVDHASRAN